MKKYVYEKLVSCFYCGKEKFVYKHSKSKRNFCDMSCYGKQKSLDPANTVFANKKEGHPAWKGGRRKSSNGYIEVYKPDHHRARGNGYVYEHIVVMEEKLGKKVKRHDGHIHHRDENKTNNDPDNLRLMDGALHISMHNAGVSKFSGKVKGYESHKVTKEEKIKGIVIPKEKLPRGYYYLRILV